MDTVAPPLLTLARYEDPSVSCVVEANPPEFAETFGTEWAKLKVPGLSHSVKQFTQTVDRAVTFKLDFFAIDGGRKGVARLKSARQFLISSCRPRKLAGSIATGGSPLVVFMWPNFITLVGNLEMVTCRYTRFNRIGEPVEMVADIKIEEVRFTLATADDVEESTLVDTSGVL